jgi:hypothetical protein
MTSEHECYVYIVPPGATEFVTAGRFQVSPIPAGDLVGRFIYGRRYLERNMACGNAGRYANRKNLLSQHGRFLLSGE